MLGRKNEYLQYIERGGLCWVESNIDANTVPVCICTNVEQIQDTYSYLEQKLFLQLGFSCIK